MIQLSLIIVSYNTKQLLKNCLLSVIKALGEANLTSSSEIIVVDNASADNSLEMVSAEFPQVQILKNSRNLGFGGANNMGITRAKGEYILLLNSDALLNSSALSECLSILEKNRSIGVVGCKLVNGDNSFQSSFGYFPTLLRIFYWMLFIDDLPLIGVLIKSYHVVRETYYTDDTEVDWVSGAYFFTEKKVLVKAGLFDPKMFMYVEEVDLCFRIKKQGWKILFTPKVSVTHLKGRSGIGKNAGLMEEFKGLQYFYQKYFKFADQLILKFLLKLGALLRVVVFGIMGNSEKKQVYLQYLKLA